jgi:FAD/FMN-containing dehydrogenase
METLAEVEVDAEEILAFENELTGPLFQRGDSGYQAEIDGFNSLSPMAPDFVVGAVDDRDIQTAVRFAVANNLDVVVQATGHGSYRIVSEGVLIRTHRLNQVSIDASSQMYTIGAGACWSDILPKLGEHGLTAVTGSAPSVGAVGLTLGGGLGPLGRTLGWAADLAVSYRVVVADGSIVVASETSNPDLFWALKGGKVGLGIVAEMTLRALPLSEFYGGALFFAEEDIEAVHRAWLDWTAGLPDAVNTSIAIFRMPPEGVPEPLAGRTLAHVRFAYVEQGASAEELTQRGEAHLAAIRAVAPVYLDGVGVLAAQDVGTIHADPPGPLPVWEHGEFLDQVDQSYVSTILEHAGTGVDSPFACVETRFLGGAIAQKPALPNAIGGTQARFSLLAIAAVIPGVTEEALPIAGPALFDAVSHLTHAEVNYNWAGHPTPEVFARLWSAETAEKLARVRKTYDPSGVFGRAIS